MAMSETGKTGVSVKIQQWQTGRVFDCVVKDGVTIERSTNEPSTLTCEILRDAVSPEPNDIITVTLDGGHNCFYGYIKKESKKKQWASITAYDQLWFMQHNKIPRFIYEDATASDVYKRIIEDNELKTVVDQHIMDTEYRIPYRIESNVSYLDIVVNALNLDYENTGKKSYIWDDYGNLCMHTEEWMSEQPYLQVRAEFVQDYTYEEDATEQATAALIMNEVKEEDKEEEMDADDKDGDGVADPADPGTTVPDEGGGSGDTGETGGEEDTEKTPEEEDRENFEKEKAKQFVVYSARNEEAIEKFGYVLVTGDLEEGENGEYKVKKILKENEEMEVGLTLNGVQGDIQIRGGSPLLVDFFSQDRIEYIRGWYSVDRVTHKIEHGVHTMDLNLTCILKLDDWSTDDPDYTFKRPESEDDTEEEESQA